MKRSCLFPLLFLISILLSAQTPQIMWYYDVNDESFGNSALADIDNDGKPEIVFSNYRNDSSIYVLNADDGSLLWKYNTGGCNDVAPLIIDTDQDGDLEIVLPSSCVAKTFCFDADSGYVEWVANSHGSDSPPTAADIDNDGRLEILHGEFGGWVLCLNAEDGSHAWNLPVDMNSWIQTAPAILDVDNNGQLDFVIANWNFDTDHRIWAFRGDNQQQIWTDTMPDDYMYHGTAFADIDKDGYAELTIGDYEGNLLCLNAEDGSLKWHFSFPSALYIGAPTSIGDLDSDGWLDILFISGWEVGALDHNGNLKWKYTVPAGGQSFRGAALVDMNSDDTLDVVFGTSKGHLMVLNGSRGNLLFDVDLRSHYGSNDFEFDHGPVVADFDNDGDLDVFIVGGHAEYPSTPACYGRGYAVSFPSSTSNGTAPWPMFRHDERRSGCVEGYFVGTNELPQAQQMLEVYPNPASSSVDIKLPDGIESLQRITLFDVTGKQHEVHWTSNDNIIKLTLSGVPSGLYLGVIVDENGQKHWFRVVKAE